MCEIWCFRSGKIKLVLNSCLKRLHYVYNRCTTKLYYSNTQSATKKEIAIHIHYVVIAVENSFGRFGIEMNSFDKQTTLIGFSIFSCPILPQLIPLCYLMFFVFDNFPFIIFSFRWSSIEYVPATKWSNKSWCHSQWNDRNRSQTTRDLFDLYITGNFMSLLIL